MVVERAARYGGLIGTGRGVAFDQLLRRVQGDGATTGRLTQAMQDAPGVLLEREPRADAAAWVAVEWVAVEWVATAHAIRVYDHPGRALLSRRGLGPVDGTNGDDSGEDADADGVVLDAARVQLMGASS